MFEAGSSEDGRPYFVMELVKGVPISRFCDARELSTKQRLELFLRVCDGVQHAHQKAILHRDLKPTNVLVVETEDGPSPKIIDFGIARALDEGPELGRTRVGQVLGTPAYMSPEQASGSGSVALDVRSDVYSLGVMLYELLVGSHPFFEGPDDEPSFDELSRRLREQEPPRPSSKVMGSGDAELLAARVRGTVPAALSRTLREELDWIVLRALEREPDRRYGSVLELAGDLRRHLQHLPVLASPPDSIYRLRKFVRRNRWPVTGAAALALALVAAVAGTSVGMVRARRAETAAQAEAEVAEEVTRLLTDLFAADNPYQYGSERPTVGEILEAASQRLEEGKVRDPRVRRRLSRALADLALAHGHFDQARDLLERAAGDLSSRAADSNDSLEIRLKLATVDRQSGRLQEASDRLEELLPEARSRLGEKDLRLGLVLLELGLVQADLQRPRQGETWFRQALSVFRSLGCSSRRARHDPLTTGAGER